MLRAVADTHALIWYVFDDPRLSSIANLVFDAAEANGDQVAFSPVSIVEIIYLIEKGRIQPATLSRVMQAIAINSFLVEAEVDAEMALAVQQVPRTQVPDMPDRIIAATALHLGVPLISRDQRISLSAVATVW